MSTALSQRTEALPAVAILPKMSGSLAYCAAGERRLDGHVSPLHGTPSPADRAEAQRLLPQVEHLCREPDGRIVAEWCARLVPSVRNPPGQQDLRLKVQAIAMACADLPAAVWTAATLTEAMGAFAFWPAAADVRTLLMPHAERLWRQRDGLKRVASMREEGAADHRDAPSEDEKAAVSSIVNQLIADQKQEPTHRPKAEPRHLSDGALLATYERLAADGNQAAATRAAMLRARLEA